MRLRGTFTLKQERQGRVIATRRFHNDITDVGLRDIINVMFREDTTPAYELWYMGLIDSSGFTGLSNSDIMSNHPGWVEFEDYSEGVRQDWVASLLASPATFVNSAPAVFTIDATGSIQGMYIASDDTVGGSSGFLWSTATFGAPISVVSSDVFRCQYQLEASR